MLSNTCNIKNGTIFVMKWVQNEQSNPIPKIVCFKETIFAGSHFKMIFSFHNTTPSIIICKNSILHVCGV